MPSDGASARSVSIVSRNCRSGTRARPGSVASSVRRTSASHGRRALVAAHALDLLDRLRADAARRHVDDAAQGDRVLRGEDEPEVGEDVLHLLPLVEADAAEDEVRDARAQEALFDEPALRVHAHEDGHPPPAAQARRALDDPRRLLELVHRLVEAHRLAARPAPRAASCPCAARCGRRGRRPRRGSPGSSGSSPRGGRRARPGSRARSRGCSGCRPRARSRSTGPRRPPR